MTQDDRDKRVGEYLGQREHHPGGESTRPAGGYLPIHPFSDDESDERPWWSRTAPIVLAAATLAACAGSPGIHNGVVDVDGGFLSYEVAGSGEPVVLIHGNCGDRRHWDEQFGALAVDHRVIRYDLRGFGASSLPEEGRPYADHDDLAALLDHLDVEAAHVIGFSLGSAIAVDFALAYPERTRSLVPVGPWVFGYASPAADALFEDFARVGAAMKEGGAAAAAEAWKTAPFLVATVVDPAAGERLGEIVDDHSFWAFAHDSPRRTLEPGAAGRLGELRVPTLVLAGERDIPGCLEVADLLAVSVPGARKVILERAGHLLQFERPAAFNRHLIGFIDAVAVAAE